MNKSCLKEFYTAKTKLINLNNCELPIKYNSVETEYEILRKDTAIIDGFGYEIIKVYGENAETFLNKHITKDIVFLNEGSITECMIINEDAAVLAFVFICKFEDYYLLLIPPEKKCDIFAYLSSIIENNVNLISITNDETLIFLEGPKSWKMVRDVLNVEVDTVALRTIIETSFNGQSISVARIGRSGEYGYALMANEHIIINIIKECLNNQIGLKCNFCGLEALYLCMLEIHQPNLNLEHSETWNMFELGYQWFVQYDKTEYIGYKTLMKLFSEGQNQNSVGFICYNAKEKFDEDSKIFLYDECVGTVLYSLYNPTHKFIVGMAMLDKKVAASGIELLIKNENNDFIIKTLSSPYVRPLSWDEKIED